MTERTHCWTAARAYEEREEKEPLMNLLMRERAQAEAAGAERMRIAVLELVRSAYPLEIPSRDGEPARGG